MAHVYLSGIISETFNIYNAMHLLCVTAYARYVYKTWDKKRQKTRGCPFVCLSVCRQRVVVGHWLTGACAAAGGRRDVGTPEQRVSQIFFPREKTLP